MILERNEVVTFTEDQEEPELAVASLSILPDIVLPKKAPTALRSPYEAKGRYTGDKLEDYEIAMWLLKSHESLRLTAYWDVSQWTIGWGTPSKKGETITKLEADRRVRTYYDKVFNRMKADYPDLDDWTLRVVSVAKYNLGSFGAGMKSCLASGDRTRIFKKLQEYRNVDCTGMTDKKCARIKKGLRKRRLEEGQLMMASSHARQWQGQDLKQIVIDHIKKNR
jgi:GH24 family phage-related lysozyme (muramidase)